MIVVTVSAQAECTLKMLSPHGSEIFADHMAIALGQADDMLKPAAWQGPVTAGACTFDLGIIEQPLALAAGRYLYVPTYSGSIRNVTVLDLRTCLIRWKSTAFSGAVSFSSKGLDLGGQHVKLDAQCVPVAKSK